MKVCLWIGTVLLLRSRHLVADSRSIPQSMQLPKEPLNELGSREVKQVAASATTNGTPETMNGSAKPPILSVYTNNTSWLSCCVKSRSTTTVSGARPQYISM